MAPAKLTDEDRKEIRQEFRQAVNMAPAALRKWLESRPSRSVGMKPGGEKVTSPGKGEAVGHHMGRRILEIRAKKQAEYGDQDYRDMRKVVGYVHRHLAQRPDGDVANTRWRKSLMNWGHDPLR